MIMKDVPASERIEQIREVHSIASNCSRDRAFEEEACMLGCVEMQKRQKNGRLEGKLSHMH